MFSSEGVPVILVDDNGLYFEADLVTIYSSSIWFSNHFAAHRQPRSSGWAEK